MVFWGRRGQSRATLEPPRRRIVPRDYGKTEKLACRARDGAARASFFRGSGHLALPGGEAGRSQPALWQHDGEHAPGDGCLQGLEVEAEPQPQLELVVTLHSFEVQGLPVGADMVRLAGGHTEVAARRGDVHAARVHAGELERAVASRLQSHAVGMRRAD